MTTHVPADPAAGGDAAACPAHPVAPAAAPRDLPSALRETARSAPLRPATILPTPRLGRRPEHYTSTSYAELDRRSDAIAAGLRAYGIVPGMRTVLLVPPGADFVPLFFGLLKAGAVPVLVDPGIGREHLKTCLAEADPGAFVGVPRAQLARRLLGWCPGARLHVTVGRPALGGTTLKAVERAGAAELARTGAESQPAGAPAAASTEVSLIAFTSGSTGVPKGVEYRTGELLAQAEILRSLYDLSPGEVTLVTFPPFALLGPALGLTTVMPPMDFTRPADVDAALLVDAVERHGATAMFGSPALLETVSRWGAQTGGRMPTLRCVLSAGAPVSRAVQRRLLPQLGPDAQIHSPYGATEALPVTTIGSTEVLALRQTGICVGRPVPGVDLAVVPVTDGPLPAVDDAALPPGVIGELVVRGPNVTQAYFGRPAATAAAKTTWGGMLAHRLGDAGYLDDEGRVWFCGRVAHRVLAAEGPMYSVPCEELFNAHPAVRRAALVGVGPAGSQRPVICIELESGGTESAKLAAELLAQAAQHPQTRAIRTLLFFPTFPVDIRHNSKIRREELAEEAGRRLS